MQPSRAPSLKDLLIWGVLLPAFVSGTGLQHQDAHYPSKADHQESLSVDQQRYHASGSLQTPLSGQRDPFDRNVNNKDDRPRSRSPSRSRASRADERAIATFASSGHKSAVRAFPPALTSSVPLTTAGLLTRRDQPARSLEDWQVEDIVLLATVDGQLHAVDRKNAATKWTVMVDKPMVDIEYHWRNRSEEDAYEYDETGRRDQIWVVEPSQDGAIYIYNPRLGHDLKRLPATVKSLFEQAPYAFGGHIYTGEKKTMLYTIDAANGKVLREFSSSGALAKEASCKRINPLETLEDEECEPIRTITIGRTEYTIGVQDGNSIDSEPLCIIRYFEWTPNTFDNDLRLQYAETLDKKYVYTKHDGSIYLGRAGGDIKDFGLVNKKLEAPVARAFDVVRPVDEGESSASLVVLPQPVDRSANALDDLEDDRPESVYVRCDVNGSCYALSETNYPIAARNAPKTHWYERSTFYAPAINVFETGLLEKAFSGVHELHRTGQPGQRAIDAPQYPGIDAPPPKESEQEQAVVSISQPSTWGDQMVSLKSVLMLFLIIGAACGTWYAQDKGMLSKSKTGAAAESVPADIPEPNIIAETRVEDIKDAQQLPQTPKLREHEPAKETIFPHESTVESSPDREKEDDDLVRVDTADAVEEVEENGNLDTPKQKGHKRGKRGGRKQREKEQNAAEAKAKRKATNVPQPAEVITVAASESAQVAGPLQINSLIIHTDKVIGQGSCGTCVFEGSFEGREVAVKRMLSQYYELASQEVSFLQQSDDHQNVVRYFCQQKDDHFLYIAVELCQASLFEVWDPDKARAEERQTQLRNLKLSIQQDPPRALKQLADGLYHLHNLRIIHRDIKPQNILVAFPKRGQVEKGPRLVISDFGLGKNLPENVSTLIDPTGNAGTSGWKAPELISQPRESSSHSQSHHTNDSANASANGTPSTSGVKRAADIFSLGCLFFWVLTDGIHPYEDENGWQQLRELNIKRDNKKMGALERWNDAYEPMQLITSMLEHRPEHRPTALQVLNHPFFWSADKRLAFLCDCSDHFEREPRGVPTDGYAGDSDDLGKLVPRLHNLYASTNIHPALLESRSEEIIGPRADFLAKLDRAFVDTLGKQRKYSGNRVLDLLRALRNKKNHYEDMPESVKKLVGALPDGYLTYWTSKFPRLLMACYEVIHELRIEKGDRFKGYFQAGSV
ncbi:serine/threonine-protein kinase/endoribonuclease IRE1-like [Teratosphaeria destructans]|uniref:non-specific serine/threonine protein kinase n=1 Tax=Teratosphaeria destructans TaxID=418781 RepID=A0A9W7VZ86_9PEZI|nr:serine/threonine-protein kinase/endoribonuclease IRE1-like [Teratosphaeria destructans]